MKKLFFVFCNFGYALTSSAQRYTGYGRGMDWGSTSNTDFSDYLFFIIIIFLVIIGGVINLRDKILSKISITYNLESLNKFRQEYEYFERGCVVDSYTGDYFDLCIFIKKGVYCNINYYVAFSSYLKPLSYYELLQREDSLYLKWDSRGAYFICTKESEKNRIKDSENSENYKKDGLTAKMVRNLNGGSGEREHLVSVL